MVDQKTATRRETAKLSTVGELLSGEYVVREGWQSNYIQTAKRQLSRVNLMGLVVAKDSLHQFHMDDGTGTIIVTDFNQTKQSEIVKVGDAVLVIGRPRRVNDVVFVATEAIQSKQLKEQPKWLTYRKNELKEMYATLEESPDIVTVTERTVSSEQKEQTQLATANARQQDDLADVEVLEETFEDEIDTELEVYSDDEKKTVLDSVKVVEPVQEKTLSGDDIVDFVRKKDTGDGCLIDDIVEFFGDAADDIVTMLISMGEIYEIKPGKVKVLE